MKELDAAVAEALRDQANVDALGCVDLQSGLVLAVAARSDWSRDALDVAAQAASQLCAAPRLDAPSGADEQAREALVVSGSAVHAFARTKHRGGWAIIGVARGGANVALLLASVRAMAESVGGDRS